MRLGTPEAAGQDESEHGEAWNNDYYSEEQIKTVNNSNTGTGYKTVQHQRPVLRSQRPVLRSWFNLTWICWS